MFPLVVNLSGRTVLVVGAGVVGTRRTAALVAAGARVRLVDPDPTVGSAPDSRVVRVIEPYSPRHLDGVALAFACATPDVNAAVVADARAAGIWVGDAAEPDRGDVIVPSVVRQGDLMLAVSTGGASPHLASRIAAELSERYDPAYADWVRILGEVRAVVKQTAADAATRRTWLGEFCEPHWLARIRTAGPDVTRAEMLAALNAPRGEE
jgi:precorrin-2 dehydrogenase / sirohydrochlorin ferrochelatase